MDRKRAAAALLALAACIACSAAAPTANDHTALELMNGPTEGCYYNFQHYGEGDRIMTNEPCLNCTCHNRMLMCYLRVCPFTKPIGQDCTVEKRADQCCPIVTCPDVPVDLLTSTSTSSPAEYGTTGIGKLDKYGCSINGKYFSEGSKVPSTPNKPCEHCYCIRNMTTCVMQECTLHVDGCTPIYHKDVCCPVRYSCDHPEDDILLLDDMTTTVRPTPGFLLTTTTAMPVTQITQDCVHDDQIFPDGTLIKTEKACEHCYCMKGDIVCVVQECGTPMENEGKNCTSLPPRHGQCCPDTYICEGDDHGTELTTEIIDQTTQPPRRVGVEGSGYRNEPDELYTEKSPFETDIEGSGEDYATDAPVITVEDVITDKIQPDIIDEILLATTEKEQMSHSTESDNDQNTIPDIIPGIESSDLPETITQTTEANVEIDSGLVETSPEKTKTTDAIEYETPGFISKEDDTITTESAFTKEDNNIVSDEILTIKEQEKLPTTSIDLVDETTIKDEHLNESTDSNLPSVSQSTTISKEYTTEVVEIMKEKETTTENLSSSSSTEKNKSEDELLVTPSEEIFTGITTMAVEKTDIPETTTANPEINEVDENISPPGRIPGEGDCLLNGITYRNNTIVPSSNNCHTSCKCTSSIIKCDPIICSSPPEYMENMNDCQPIYDSPDACCPTYVCSAKETIPPQSHSQMSGTESPKPITVTDCNGQDCRLDEEQKPISEPSSSCTSVDCLTKPAEKQDKDKIDCSLNDCTDETQKPPINQDCSDNKCPVLPVVACEGENCLTESVTSADTHKTPMPENAPPLVCDENEDCKKPEHTQQDECKDETCVKQEVTETEVKAPLDCTEPECKMHEKPDLPSTMEQSTDLATEKISTDKVTEITITKLDKATESPEKTITTLTDENITENPTSEVTKLVETIPLEGLDDTSESSSDAQGTADNSEQTESPTTQSILEQHDDKKLPEETSIEHITESSGSQGNSEDEVNKETPTDPLTTNKEMDIDETSEQAEIKPEDKSTDKIEITTEHFEIFTDSNVYSTKDDEATGAQDSENQKTGTEMPDLDKNELEKLTPTEANVDTSEKDPIIKEVSEMHETKEENTEIPEILETMTTQRERISTDFNKATETYEASQVTNEPQYVETYTEKEKITEEPESHGLHEIMTDKNIADIADVTQPSESQVTKDGEVSTEKSVIVTESHIIPTDLPQSMQTKLDEVTTKDVNQETITDKQEIFTEPSDYFTAHHEETTSELSVQPIDNLSTTQIKSEVTEEPASEKVTTFTESSEILQTKTEEIMHESEQPVTEKQEIYTKTPDHLREKSDEDQKIDVTETDKAFTEAIESDITKKQEIFTESPKVDATTLEESITKDYEIKIDSSSTELPTVLTTLAETIVVTEKQDIDTKESEEPITEKESHISDEIIKTTSETFTEPTAEIDQHLTQKPEVAMTESTPIQTIAETDSYVQPTSGEQNQVDEHDLESPQLPTTIQENVIAHEVTTIAVEPIAITDSQTKSPSLADEKLYETSTDIQEELPLQTDINEIDATTQQSPKKPDESFTHPVSQSEYTTEYATESQNVHTTVMDESQSQLDSSTIASAFEHKPEESTDSSKPHEETEDIFNDVTTINPQSQKEEVDKETTLPKDSEEISYDMEKTTASLISVEEKETETLSYTTDSNVNIIEQEIAKTTTGVIIDKEVHETTEKSISEEERLPHPTDKYIPSEGITEEITSQTLHDISTEKVHDDVTLAPNEMGTTQSELFTKSEESSMTEITVDGKEKEIVTELPHSYVTSDDLDETSAPADKAHPDESTYKSEEDNQEFSTPSATKPEMEKDVTKTPIAIVTDVDHITETSLPEKDEIFIESTTKTSDDQSLEAEREPTVSDSYTTESQKEVSEKTNDVTTQHQDITTDKITMTENPEYLSTSHAHVPTLSSLEEKVKIPQQETTTEKLADQTNPSDLQPTSSESTAQNTEEIPVSTTKEEILNTVEETTQKSLEDLDKAYSHSFDYQTTESVSKDDNTSELSHKEISTMSPELSEPEKDDNEVTENITNTSEINLETVTEKEKSPEPVDIEAHTITTQRNEVDIATYTSPDTISTDSVTENKESDILQHEHDITGIPVLTETQTSTVATKLITEHHEIAETESLTKDVATTESQYTTVAEQKESSTEASDLSSKEPERNINDDQKLSTTVPEAVSTINEDTEIKISQSTNIPYQPEVTTSGVDSQEELDIKDKLTTFVTEDTNIYIESTKPTITEKEKLDQPEIFSTQPPKESETEVQVTQKESDKITTESVPTVLPNVDVTGELSESTERQEKPYVTEENKQTTDSDYNLRETTPFLVELEEHTHRVVDEITTKSSLEEITTTMLSETHASQTPERGDQIPDDINTFTHSTEEYPVSEPSKTTVAALEHKEHPVTHVQEQIDEHTTVTPLKSEPEITLVTEKIPTPTSSAESVETKKDTTVRDDAVITSTISQIVKDKDYTTESIEIQQTPTSTLADDHSSSDKDITSEKPLQPEVPEESEEKLTPEIPKETTSKIEEEISTYSPPHIDNVTKPKEKPGDTTLRPTIPEVPKPEFIDDNVEVPSPDFPPSGGYGQEPDYIDEDQAFGPGTCRYGGKVYVSAQQIPRDDPCDFCFCFRSDIICLQQSCPPPIHGCHEEPIQGFCCPRYECPVSMATTLNVTTTTTTTTTTLPPHFLPHAYKGAAQRRGCQIKGHTYKVGEVVRASSGPCLHCTCGGDGQMKCDPKACTPEPMLRQMIAAAVSAKRRR